jgi:hypothetical protein
MRVPAPHLRLVSEDGCQAAHARLNTRRAQYGAPKQRPVDAIAGTRTLDVVPRYLLTGMGRCAVCGGGWLSADAGLRGVAGEAVRVCVSLAAWSPRLREWPRGPRGGDRCRDRGNARRRRAPTNGDRTGACARVRGFGAGWIRSDAPTPGSRTDEGHRRMRAARRGGRRGGRLTSLLDRGAARTFGKTPPVGIVSRGIRQSVEATV